MLFTEIFNEVKVDFVEENEYLLGTLRGMHGSHSGQCQLI